MKDNECVQFLQWALPRMQMRWPGFRRVRRQVCKRLERRLRELELPEIDAYRSYLESHPREWEVLDGLCRVTVSRFYRDQRVFATLEQEVMPALAQAAIARGADRLRLWSAGCACGEEPYTLALLWRLRLAERFPGLGIRILATDSDALLIERAQQAGYPFSSVKNLPGAWRDTGFTEQQGQYCLRPEYRRDVEFRQHDVRGEIPDGPFDLILCRNLAFTYYDHGLQLEVMNRLRESLVTAGVLVIGVHETLPEGGAGFTVRSERLGLYQNLNP